MSPDSARARSPWPSRGAQRRRRSARPPRTASAGEVAGHLRHRRLPQPHDLLRRLDLDAEAGQEVDRQAGHAVGPRLVRAGRPRRQRQSQLHAGRRRDASRRRPIRWCTRPTARRAGPDHDLAEHQSRRCSRRALVSGTAPNQNMWRWQSIQEFQYPVLEYLSRAARTSRCSSASSRSSRATSTRSMSVITGQMPAAIFTQRLPTTPGYTPLGNATALAQWEYCFDRGDTDTSRGNTTSAAASATTGTARSPAA